jgi:hypothetical protein
MALRLQYASNLMLPFRNSKRVHQLIKPSAPYLTLLGNIGRPECKRTRDFFKWAAAEFETVYWIPGSLEYSSYKDHAVSWTDAGHLLYSFCNELGVNNVFVCQKQDIIFPGTNIRVLATPHCFTHSPPMKCYTWDLTKGHREMTREDMMNMYIAEHMWFKINLERIEKPTIVLSHTRLNPTLQYTHLLANLYGTNWRDIPGSVSGSRAPWLGLNMAGHRGFIPDAVLEIEPDKF